VAGPSARLTTRRYRPIRLDLVGALAKRLHADSSAQCDGTSWPRTVEAMVDPSADRAAFRRLADRLRDQIQSGALAPGEPLPSELRPAQQYGISRTSVRQAIGHLRTEGLVTVDRPRGTFVRVPEPTETITWAAAKGRNRRRPSPGPRRRGRSAHADRRRTPCLPPGRRRGGPGDHSNRRHHDGASGRPRPADPSLTAPAGSRSACRPRCPRYAHRVPVMSGRGGDNRGRHPRIRSPDDPPAPPRKSGTPPSGRCGRSRPPRRSVRAPP
jgi:DNA-binding transcriptional regulator YhcF (GntR family)